MTGSDTFERLAGEMEDRMDEWLLVACGLTPATDTDVRYAAGRAYNEVAPGQDDLEAIAEDLGYTRSYRNDAFWSEFEISVAEHLSRRAQALVARFASGHDPRFSGERLVVVRVGRETGLALHAFHRVHAKPHANTHVLP